MDIRMLNIASPMPQIRAKFTNKLGIPLSGCKVYTYEPNSDIPKTTWIDIDKTVENTNPILLDAAGEADIFLDGLYRIVVKDRFGFVVYDVEKTGVAVVDASFVVDESGLSQQEINDTVKSEMPFSTHAYTTLQAANDSTSGNILHLEKKPYTNSVDLDKNSIQGSGYETVLNVETGNYAIKVKQSLPNWDKLRISDLTIGGLTRVNTTGVLFDPADAVAGRRNLEYVSLNNLDIAIHKPRGNIGNTYSNVNAYDCNYVIKANSVWTPREMHSGNDTWRDFQVDHIDKWAFDYTDLTGGGAIHIKDGIIEYCNGGGIRIEYSDDYPPFIPPRISNVWFEQVAKASSVVRDGVSEVPRNIKLVNTAMCIIENCKLDNIELVNSTAVAVNCRASSTNITLDSTSNLIIENAFLHGSVPSNVTVSSIAKQSYPTHFGANLTLKGNAITGTVRKPSGSSVAVGIPFKGNIGKKWAIDGSNLVYADTVSDNGVICAELSLIKGNNYVLPYITTPASQWVVWGISAKQVGGLSGSFRFSMDYNLGDIILRDGEWNHSFGIAKTPSAPMNIRAILSPTTNGTIRIRDYFIVAFERESEAVAFLNSRTSVNTYPELIQHSFTGTVAANRTTSVNVDFLGASLGDTFGCAMNSYTAGIRVRAETSEQNVVKLHIENITTNSITLTSALANIQMLT